MADKNIPDFKDKGSLQESLALLYSATTILRIAMGEVCSVNSRVDKSVFSGSAAKGVIKTFDDCFKIMRTAYDAFNNRLAELDKESAGAGSNS